MKEDTDHSGQFERKFSARLANKRKPNLSVENKLSDESIDFNGSCNLLVLKKTETSGYLQEVSNESALLTNLPVNKSHHGNRSRSFLDCLELKPVNISESTDQSKTEQNESRKEPAEKVNASGKKNAKNRGTSSISSVKKCKKNKKSSKVDMKIEEDMNASKSNAVIFSVKCDALSSEKTSEMTDGVEMTSCGNQNEKVTLSENPLESKQMHDNSEQESKINSQVYIFRDLNKVAVNCSGLPEDDSMAADFLGAVDLNRHGKKRRYDKLIKKLVDGEKKLEINFKEINHDDIDKSDINLCVEKMKEKLRVREKKKYEYLINYMRDQWRVDQKSFQDLLPQKVDLVKANIVKQLGASSEKVITEKRVRGRPKKITATEVKDLSKGKKSPSNQSKKNYNQRKKNSAATRGFPVKFPKSLLSDTNISFNRQKCEKFRLGIVDKNGSQEIIELNSETLKGIGKNVDNASLNIGYDKSEDSSGEHSVLSKMTENIGHTREGDEGPSTLYNRNEDMSEQAISSHALLYNRGSVSEDQGERWSATFDEASLDAWQKFPPTTITLPSIQSLEKDYELVSLSPSYPPHLGNFQTDHFFIPQSTFDRDGKTSMIIVGPFSVVCDPKPRLLLVSPENQKKGPIMILRKKIHSPSSTPPRDFRIKKDSRRVCHPEQVGGEPKERQQGDPAIVLLDHNYMTPVELRDTIKRYSKAVAKHSANAKFINARVEDITQGEDNYVVTIKGANVLHQVKHMVNSLQAPLHCNEEGMPIVYSLSQVMTSSLDKAQEIAHREEMILESQQTGDYTPVMFPLSTMGDVVMEVLIPPGGTEIIPRTQTSKQWSSPEVTQKYDEEVTKINALELSALHSGTKEDQCEHQEVRFLHSKTPVVLDCDSHSKEKENPLAEKTEHVVIENEAAVDAGPRPGLPCCRMCLRLFPSDYVLFTHVRSSHATCEIRDSVYLEELRARSRLACPVCCNPPVYLPTPPKLRRHLRLHHGIEHYIAVCRICRAEFLDKQELHLHVELSHNAFSSRGLVSLLKRQQTGRFGRGQRSLLSECLSCNRCSIGFSDRASLLSHTLEVHPELNQFNICRLCDRVFDSGLALHKHLKKAHEQTHNGALKCPFCPAWLPNIELASVHRATLHNGAVPVHCPFCGAGYQSLHPMYNHVRSQHLQTEAHICPECQASFPASRMLSEHVRKAHLMTPYIMKENLHSSNTTTYCCPFCAVSFMRTYDLAVHVINAHKDHLLPAQCHMCMQSFVSEVVMKIHMSGAHGIDIHPQDGSGGDVSYGHFDEGESVTFVLEDMGEDIYSHRKSLDAGAHSTGLMRKHFMDAQDILETQEAGHYIQDLDDRDTETIVYLNKRNQVVNTGEMFGTCNTMEDVQMLGEPSDDFNLHGVDYLETLTNDSIAVGADVVADVGIDIANGRGVDRSHTNSHQDILSMAGQFEIDGVLYELTAPLDSTAHHLQSANNMITIDGSDLGVAGDRITIDANDLAQILRQQVQ